MFSIKNFLKQSADEILETGTETEHAEASLSDAYNKISNIDNVTKRITEDKATGALDLNADVNVDGILSVDRINAGSTIMFPEGRLYFEKNEASRKEGLTDEDRENLKQYKTYMEKVQALSSNVSDLTKKVADSYKSKAKDFILDKTKWNGRLYVIEDSRVEANSEIVLDVPPATTEEVVQKVADAELVCYAQSDGHLTLQAQNTVPTENIPLRMAFI